MVNLKKKGISGIVVSILIVLLAIAAIVLMWGFVKPILNNVGNLEVGINSLNPVLSVPQSGLVYEKQDNANFFVVMVKREAGSGDIQGVRIVLTDSNGNSYATEHIGNIKELS